jgi:hypothetical protein
MAQLERTVDIDEIYRSGTTTRRYKTVCGRRQKHML